MIRAVRLAATLDFEVEAETLAAIGRNADLAEHLSGERIFTELGKLLADLNDSGRPSGRDARFRSRSRNARRHRPQRRPGGASVGRANLHRTGQIACRSE